MRFALLVFALIVTALLGGCPPPGPVVPQPDADAAVAPVDDGGVIALDALPTPPVQDAAPTPTPIDAGPSLDDCARAEANLVKLGCKDSRGQPYSVTKGGRSFAAVCRAAADAGVDVHPACIAVSTTCAKVTSCSL